MKKIYLFLILIPFIGCEKDEIISPTLEPNLTSQIQSQFSLSKYDDEYVKDNLKVNWHQVPETEVNAEFHEFSTNINSVLQKESSTLYYKYTVIANLKENKMWEFHIVKFTAFANGELQNVSLKKPGGFTGTIHQYNFAGILQKIEALKEGKIISSYNGSSAFSQNADAKYYPAGWDDPSDGYWIMTFTRPTIDYYQNSGAGGAYEYSYSRMGATTSEWVHAGGSGYTSNSSTNPYHNHYDNPHGPAVGSDNHPVEILKEEPAVDEDKIDETSNFKINDKINCTYIKLKETSEITDILKDFFGDDAINDITFDVTQDLVCNGNSNSSGCTTPLGGNAYRVDVDLDYINSNNTPTIFLAQTLIHESIHANLFAAVKGLNNGMVPEDASFVALYEDYRGLKNWSHEFMADHYIDIMKVALKEVHPLLNDSSFLNGYSDNTLWDWDKFYEYVSYRGLKDTAAGRQYSNDLTNNISLYLQGTESNSTKTPNCD